MNENASPEPGSADAPAPPPPPLAPHQEFLKKHVRGIPKEQLEAKRVYYGFKYKDLKAFIEQIVGQYQGVGNPELVAKISELEMALQSLRGQKAEADARTQALAGDLEKARAGAEGAQTGAAEAQAAAGREAEERASALEAEKAALEARVAELESGLSGAGDAAQRAADLAAELAALKESFAKLEGENEFMDGEMTKLDEKNKALEERLRLAEEGAKALQEAGEKAASGFDGERKSLLEKTVRLEQIVKTSGDAKKLLEMQKQYETYAKAFEALQAGAEEMVDLERRPDPKELDGRLAALRGRVPAGSPPAGLLALLERRLAAARKEIGEKVQEMYAYRGSFRAVVDLEKAVVREQELAGALELLERTAG